MSLSIENKAKLLTLQSTISDVLQAEMFDEIACQSICSTNGWINCLIDYGINPVEEDLENLTTSVDSFKNDYL